MLSRLFHIILFGIGTYTCGFIAIQTFHAHAYFTTTLLAGASLLFLLLCYLTIEDIIRQVCNL